MATKAFKNEKIDDIKEVISKAKVAVVTDYRGLTVEEITNLRRKLQAEKGDYTVVKNTLAKRATVGTEFEKLAELLKGPSAVAFGFEDQVSPAKVITQFIKENKKGDIIRGAVLEGNVLSEKEVIDLSKLPSKEELYAKILGGINSPASGLVNSVNGIARALVIAMEAVRKQKEAQS